MALTAYQDATNRLLQNPVTSPPLFTTANLTTYINDARQQIAGAAEAIFGAGSFTLTSGIASYLFSAFTGWSAGGAALSGIQGPISIGQMAVTVGSNPSQILYGRPWSWMQRYYLNTGAAVATGTPTRWAQRGRGANGTFVLNPTPNAANIVIVAEASLLPVALTTDATAEALPYPWTEAVPYFAAYLAMLSAQRRSDADKMFETFLAFCERATQMSTPSRFPGNFYGGLGARLAAMKQTLTTRQKAAGGQQ